MFDLDETLVHVDRSEIEDEDSVQTETEESFEPEVEIPIIDAATNNELYVARLAVRPFTKECLELANRYFEVAIFTAGK
jgi:hypothetical protein